MNRLFVFRCFLGEVNRALYGHQRSVYFGFVRDVINVLQLVHAAQHIVFAHRRALGIDDGVVSRRRHGKTCDRSGFANGELVEFLAEVDLRGRGKAVGTLTEIDLVEIDLENLVLGEMALDLVGHGHFIELARVRALGTQKEVTGHLHGDGRAALTSASRENVGERSAGNAHEFDAGVLVKTVVFGRENGIANKARNFVEAHEVAALLAVFADQGAVGAPDAQRNLGLIFRQRINGRQLGVHHGKDDHEEACAAYGRGKAEAGQATEPLEPAAGFGFGFLRGHGTGATASRRTSRFLEKHV